MGRQPYRWIAVASFAAGAVLAGAGNAAGEHAVTALAIPCFGAGVLAYFRWRTIPGKVLDREEKTSSRSSETEEVGQ